MGWYNRTVLPRIIELAMRQAYFEPFRQRAAGSARGRVLEIGIGSGANLASYKPEAEIVYGIDPSPELLKKARDRAGHARVPVRLMKGSSENLPFEDRSFDSVVTTFTLCSIPDVPAAMREMRRVLKPGGALLFAEHGRAPEASVVRWQDRLTPLWRPLSGGCHLNRKIDDLIRAGGFQIAGLKAAYLDAAPRPFAFIYEGTAHPG